MMNRRSFLKKLLAGGAAVGLIGTSTVTLTKTCKSVDLDKQIYLAMKGTLGTAFLTNPRLREMAAEPGTTWTKREFCLRYEEIVMWKDRAVCRGGKKGCSSSYDYTNKDCQGCFLEVERNVIKGLSAHGNWAPRGSYYLQ